MRHLGVAIIKPKNWIFSDEIVSIMAGKLGRYFWVKKHNYPFFLCTKLPHSMIIKCQGISAFYIFTSFILTFLLACHPTWAPRAWLFECAGFDTCHSNSSSIYTNLECSRHFSRYSAHIISFDSHNSSKRWVLLLPFLQLRKLRHKEVRQIVLSHTLGKGGLEPGQCDSCYVAVPALLCWLKCTRR